MGNDFFISKVLFSDENGQTEKLELPTPSKELSQTPTSALPYSLYNVRVCEPNFRAVEVYDIPIFEGITSIQPIEMNPVLKLEDMLMVDIVNKLKP